MCLSPLSVSSAQQTWTISINFHDHNIHIIIVSKNCKKKWKHEAVYLASYSKSQAGNHWFGQFDSRSFKADISFTFHALKMEYYFLQTFKDPRKPALCWTQETSLRLVLNCIPLTGSMTHHCNSWPIRHPTYWQHDPVPTGTPPISSMTRHCTSCPIRHPTFCQHDPLLHFLPH